MNTQQGQHQGQKHRLADQRRTLRQLVNAVDNDHTANASQAGENSRFTEGFVKWLNDRTAIGAAHIAIDADYARAVEAQYASDTEVVNCWHKHDPVMPSRTVILRYDSIEVSVCILYSQSPKLANQCRQSGRCVCFVDRESGTAYSAEDVAEIIAGAVSDS